MRFGFRDVEMEQFERLKDSCWKGAGVGGQEAGDSTS